MAVTEGAGNVVVEGELDAAANAVAAEPGLAVGCACVVDWTVGAAAAGLAVAVPVSVPLPDEEAAGDGIAIGCASDVDSTVGTAAAGLCVGVSVGVPLVVKEDAAGGAFVGCDCIVGCIDGKDAGLLAPELLADGVGLADVQPVKETVGVLVTASVPETDADALALIDEVGVMLLVCERLSEPVIEPVADSDAVLVVDGVGV